MDIPTDGFAVASLIVLALPGLIYSAVRRWLRGEGPEDRDWSLTFMRGVFLAVVLSAAYLLVFGGQIFDGLALDSGSGTITIASPRRVGLGVLVLYVLVPIGVSLIAQGRYLTWKPWVDRGGWRWIGHPASRVGFNPTPTAWDHAIQLDAHQAVWIRVRRADGTWLGGWFTGGSFATAYPEPRSIYIDQQWSVLENGDFGKEMPNAGIWVNIADGDVVFWTRPEKESEGA